MAKRLRGKNAIAIESVPYAIHTTINPQNMNEILLNNAPVLLTVSSLMKKNIKIPANNGCIRITTLHASINGRKKKKRLKGDNTAD